MNKKFTKLMAAIALLTFLAVPMGMRGQTRSEGDTHEFSQSLSQLLNDNASIPSINIEAQSYPVKKVTISYRYNKTIENAVTMAVSVNGVSWGTEYSTGTGSNYTTVDFEGTSAIGPVVISFTNNTGSGTGHGTFYVNKVILTEGTSNPTYTLTDYSDELGSISFAPASPVEEGTQVTLIPTPASEAYYFVENSWLFFDDELNEVTEDIEFVEGEANTIVMPAYNLTVNATFAAKPTYAITCASNNESWGVLSASPTSSYQGQTVTLSYLPETGYRLSSIAITKTEDGSATGITPVESGDGFTFEMPNYAVTATATFEAIPECTITFNAGTGSPVAPVTGLQGSPINLPSANPSTYCADLGWTFAGWAEASVGETQTAPTLLNGSYTITGNDTLYAVYQGTEGEGPTDVNMDFSQGIYSDETITWTIDNVVSILQEGNGAQSAPNQSYVSAPRWYKDNKITITPSVNINTITVTTNTDGYATALATSTFTNATASASGSVVTITPSNSGVITIVMGGQSRISSLSVNYGSSTTTYNSNPLCQLATLTVNLNNIDANLAEGDWDHEIELNESSAQVHVGAQVLVSLFVMEDCLVVGESPLTVVDGNGQSVTVEFDEEDHSYVFTMPESGATLTATSEASPQSTLTVDASSNVTLDITYGELSEIVELYENTAELCQGVEVTVQVTTIAEGYVLQSLNVVGSNGQAVSVEEVGENTYSFAMPATGATLTVTTDIDFPVNAEFALHTGELVEGDYVIYYNGYAMKNTLNNNRLTYLEVTPSENIISNPDASIVWHIAPSGDYWTIYNAAAKRYAAGKGSDNQAQLLADGTDDKSLWTLMENTTYDFENKYNKSQNKNAVLRNNGTNGWACYNPNNVGGALSLYKKVEYTAETEIIAHTQTSGWYFVASPFVGEISHNVNVGDEGTDLYYYDEQNHMWRNSKNAANSNNNFDFANGKGYLYANEDPVTLEFVGISVITSNTRPISLSYHATTACGQANSLAGWNLVGNPFNGNAILNMACYTITGTAINTEAHTAGNYTVVPCEAVMVKATGENQSVTFTKATSGDAPQPNQLQLTVAQQVVTRSGMNSQVNDNAIINFNAGSQLEKFAFNADAAKLYIPQNGKDYAIVSAEAQGEMPLNFRANTDGQYTLTVNPEGVEMNYLHLIDNMTGNDIDLLQTPNYSFNAKTTDYESRFRLVFAANNESGVSASSTTFAFYSNGNWMVNNEGEATLQVIDVMGRVLSNQTISGTAELSLNQQAGVYVLRLVNGNDVKTQKIVVK